MHMGAMSAFCERHIGMSRWESVRMPLDSGLLSAARVPAAVSPMALSRRGLAVWRLQHTGPLGMMPRAFLISA